MPKTHADGTVTNAGLALEADPSAGRMTVAEYLTPAPPEPAAAEADEAPVEGGEPSSPGTSSSPSSKRRRTKPATNAAEPRPPAPTTENR